VAIVTLERGISASKIATYEFLGPVDAWGFPKYPGSTLILPTESDLLTGLHTFVRANRALLLEDDCWLGTWIHSQSRCYYLDISTSSPTLEEARERALALGQAQGRKIVALYNAKRSQTIYL
jgi:hypothetical protein